MSTVRPSSASGAPARRLLALSASAFLVLAAEPLYLLIDTAVIGHLGSRPLAGLAVGATLMSVLGVVGAFVEYGTTSRAARWYGAGRVDAAVREGVQATLLAVTVGVLVLGIGELLAGPLTHLLAGGSERHPACRRVLVPDSCAGVAGRAHRAGGQRLDARRAAHREPVVIVVIANGLSAIVCPLLVYPAGLGLIGSAIANVAAQLVGCVLFLRALRLASARLSVPLRVSWPVVRAQLRVGRDLVVRSAAFQVAFLTAAGVAARMGNAQIAAHQIGLQLWEFTALLLDSFAIAAQSLVGAALGAADAAGARAMAWQVSRWGLYAGLGFSAVYAAGWFAIPAVFSSSPAVLGQAHVLWPWLVAMLPAAGIVFALDGVLIGAGDVAFLRTITIVAAVGAFAPLNLAALQFGWGLGGVWAGLTAFVFVRLIGMVLHARSGRWLVTGIKSG